jgi:hypothetical protein
LCAASWLLQKPPSVNRAISRREWRFVWLFALVLVVLTTLPYLLAVSSQGDGWRFSGFLFGVEDGYSYLGKMRLGARGLWDFYLFYTPEQHAAAPLIFLPYMLPGQIVGLLVDADSPALMPALALTFHILRIVFDVLLVLVLYRFIAAFVRPPAVRRAALMLATLGGGLGWLLALSGSGNPPEFYIPEAFSFLIMLGLPHLALARAALLGGLLLLFRAYEGDRTTRHVLLAAGCWWLVGLAVPFYLGIVYMILGVWGLALWAIQRRFPLRLARVAIPAALLMLPLFVYYAVVFSTNAAFALWSAQNRLPAPPPVDYLLAYGVVGLPALFGLRVALARARHDARFALLVGWVPAGLLLVYLPLNVQRRLGEAVFVPLVILAVLGVWTLARGWALRWRNRSAVRRFWRYALPLLVLASFSSAILWLGSLSAAGQARLPLFRPVAEVAAFDWLNANAPADAVVLTSVSSGNALPAFTNLRPVMGHGPETLDWPTKTEQVQRFFGGEMDAAERAALIARYNVAYILSEGDDANPPWADGLALVYEGNGYRVYVPGAR